MEQITLPRAASTRRPARLGRFVYWYGKRILDIVGSAFLLAILSPVFLVIAAAIVLDDGLPILYKCQRMGRFGRPITVLKFRTMHDGSHHHLEELLSVDEEKRLEYGERRKLRDDPRRTSVGRFLRRLSLDELPQLVNVLAGEMSIVGPRPYFPGELEGRSEADAILSVRPGITGLWQVNGRSDTTFEQRVAYDLDYVRHRGFGLDLRIVLRTLGVVVSGRGAY
ncbi:MAG TPA: sugar transferase [Candidatus Limnocylindria bacterium]|nr:sugar transferase [Candidatus Limnocylindria bacterium]